MINLLTHPIFSNNNVSQSKKLQNSPKFFTNDKDVFIPSKNISFKGNDDSNQETINWYNTNATKYFNETKDFSIKDKYPQFLQYVPEGGKILDAGCGSGRDSKCFLDMGYDVTALEASKELSTLASEHTGLNVVNATFENFKSDEKFDGIWACASLLHVPKKDFEKSFINLTDHLKTGGVMYAYLKAGSTEEIDAKGRFFNYVSPEEIEAIVSKHNDLEIVEMPAIQENTFRPGDHPFINVVVKKK